MQHKKLIWMFSSLVTDANRDAIFARVARKKTTSFPGSLFSASLGRWKKDPGCGWTRDHLSTKTAG